MTIVYTVVFTWMVIINSIEFSSQFDCLPNGAPIPGVTRRASSFSNKQHSPTKSLDPAEPSSPARSSSSLERQHSPARPHRPAEPSSPARSSSFFERQHFPARSHRPAEPYSPARSLPPARPDSPARSPSPAEPFLRVRSRTPPARYIAPSDTIIASSDGRRYGIDKLEFIRLTSYKYPNHLFELRRYTFPADKPIRIRAGRDRFEPMPTQEQIVLSTFNGDVFAILISSSSTVGIYRDNSYIRKPRAKINMESGRITDLTPDEIMEAPIGHNRPILLYFRVELINDNPSQH